VLTLLDAEGQEMSEDDDGGGGLASRLEIGAGEARPIFVRIRLLGDSAGTFELAVEADTPQAVTFPDLARGGCRRTDAPAWPGGIDPAAPRAVGVLHVAGRPAGGHDARPCATARIRCWKSSTPTAACWRKTTTAAAASPRGSRSPKWARGRCSCVPVSSATRAGSSNWC
jgi:hypothetical protein